MIELRRVKALARGDVAKKVASVCNTRPYCGHVACFTCSDVLSPVELQVRLAHL